MERRSFVTMSGIAVAASSTGTAMASENSAEKIKVALLTGGHSFDLPNFYNMLEQLKGVKVYPQHLENFASSTEEIRDSYDVVGFYNMHNPIPTDEGSTWWSGKPKTALERLYKNGQGIVLIHHAILAWREWDLWNEAVGFKTRSFKYKPNINMSIKIADKNHPVTKGLNDFEIVDEGYILNSKHDGKGKVLLTTQHENAMQEVVWTRKCQNSNVFCIALGHDNLAWSNPGFQRVVSNGMQWSAGK